MNEPKSDLLHRLENKELAEEGRCDLVAGALLDPMTALRYE